MNWYLKVLKQYADFKSRASRTEYWIFVLFNLILASVAMILDNVLGIVFAGAGIGIFYSLFALILLVPCLAVTIRRLHDIGKSGRFILLALIPVVGTIWLLVLLAQKSTPGENKYGENPNFSYTYNESTDEMLLIDHSVDSSTEDSVILIIVIWMAFSRFFWALVPLFTESQYSPGWYELVNMLMGVIWAFVPFGLAFAVKSKTKQIALFIIGGIYLLYSLFEVLHSFLNGASFQEGIM